jgi:hypothetical protein
MKKITLFVAAVAVLASCNREDALTTQSGGNAGNLNVRNFEKSELQDMITPMSQSFGFNGKAAATQANYTYRSWAEPVQLNLNLSNIEGTGNLIDGTSSGTVTAFVNLSAAAAWAVNDMVFVVWHAATNIGSPDAAVNAAAYNVNRNAAGAVGPLVGGAITAYKQVGIGQYEFMDRVDFYDADYHELIGDVNASSQNYEIMMAGQRAQATSGYVLAGHAGAVVTRIDYDYVNDEFWENSLRELPLPGTSANDVVGAARRFYVTTGGSSSADPTGAVYEFDRNMMNINKGSLLQPGYSGRALAIDNRIKENTSGDNTIEDTDDFFVLSTDGAKGVQVHEQAIFWNGVTTTFNSLSLLVKASGPSQAAHNLLERADITIASSDDNPFTDNALNTGPLLNKPDPIVRTHARTFLTLNYDNGGSSPLGVSSLYSLNVAGTGITPIPNIGNAISTEYDRGLDVLYVAMAGGGKAIKVIALDQFATQSAVVDTYDVVGEFADPALPPQTVNFYTIAPSNSFTPTIQDVKEVTVYGSRNIAIAAGFSGVFFIQRDKY